MDGIEPWYFAIKDDQIDEQEAEIEKQKEKIAAQKHIFGGKQHQSKQYCRIGNIQR